MQMKHVPPYRTRIYIVPKRFKLYHMKDCETVSYTHTDTVRTKGRRRKWIWQKVWEYNNNKKANDKTFMNLKFLHFLLVFVCVEGERNTGEAKREEKEKKSRPKSEETLFYSNGKKTRMGIYHLLLPTYTAWHVDVPTGDVHTIVRTTPKKKNKE